MAALALLSVPGLVAPTSAVAEPGQEDEFAGIESEPHTALDDAKKQYFLIGKEGAKQPRGGFKLLLVLPGGDGAAGFNAFVKRIFIHSLDESYLVAQLVAPVWDEKQAKSNVWPTKKNPYTGMEFTTEEFMQTVIEDVEASRKIDVQHIFALAWSSSGSAVYSYSMQPKHRTTGSYVAMSVFKPDYLSSLKKAKGHAYFILHSPEDFIPIKMAEAAEKKLGKARAKVKLVTYEGGHGWHGDMYGNLRKGLRFLEKEHGKPASRKGKKSKKAKKKRSTVQR